MSEKMEQYGKEVLGKRVEIKFRVDNDDNDNNDQYQFFGGTIRKLKAELDDHGTLTTEHYIIFDDDDDRLWFDLLEEESDGRLRWPPSTPAVASAGGTQLEETPLRKRIRTEDDAAAATNVTEKVNQKEHSLACVKKEVLSEDEETVRGFDSEEHQSDEIQAKSTCADADNMANERMGPDRADWPASIDAIIRFMDVREPGNRYYIRQQDSRQGCSMMRRKLRDFAKKNPDDPAVSFYVKTGKWRPPNQESLDAIIDLIKSKIP